MLLLEAPGGGGYGHPLEREPARVLVDVVNRNVSLEGARRDYGIVIVEPDRRFEVDEAATAELRRQRSTDD